MDPLVTVSELRAYLDQKIEDDDDRAALVLRLASAAVRTYVARTLTRVEDDEVTLPWAAQIVLPNPPIADVATVEVDDVEVPADRWSLGYRGGRRVVLLSEPAGTTVTVTYTHGFEEIPDAAALVTLRVAARLFRSPLDRDSGSVSRDAGSWSSSASPRVLTDDEREQLKALRVGGGALGTIHLIPLVTP